MDTLMHEFIIEANGMLAPYRAAAGRAERGGIETRSIVRSISIDMLIRAPAAYRPAQLVTFFDSRIVPYLTAGRHSGSPLRSRSQAARLFEQLRQGQGPESEIGNFVRIVDRLEAMCESRRQFDVQARLYFWLHNWLCVHAPLSWAMLILLVAHAVIALKVW
jgi:hypothetical protein